MSVSLAGKFQGFILIVGVVLLLTTLLFPTLLISKYMCHLQKGPTAPLPSARPTYTIEIMNVCVTGCHISRIHLNCGSCWFSSSHLISPKIVNNEIYSSTNRRLLHEDNVSEPHPQPRNETHVKPKFRGVIKFWASRIGTILMFSLYLLAIASFTWVLIREERELNPIPQICLLYNYMMWLGSAILRNGDNEINLTNLFTVQFMMAMNSYGLFIQAIHVTVILIKNRGRGMSTLFALGFIIVPLYIISLWTRFPSSLMAWLSNIFSGCVAVYKISTGPPETFTRITFRVSLIGNVIALINAIIWLTHYLLGGDSTSIWITQIFGIVQYTVFSAIQIRRYVFTLRQENDMDVQEEIAAGIT
ncbi:hypothetical protein ACFE04_010400 [Oxalis oulophora]